MAVTAAGLEAGQAIIEQIKQDYPAFVPLMGIPDIATLILKASAPGAQWTPQKLQAEIQGTDWWKNTSQPARNWQVLQLTQPGEASRQSAQMAVQVHQLAATEGVVLTPQDLGELVQSAQSNQWNAAQIQQAVAGHATLKQDKAGTIEQTTMGLQSTASQYGIPVSPHTAFQWAQKIAAGTATADSFTAYAKDQAKALYPTLAQHLDQGMTVRQLADPYLQIAGQVLGVDPNSLELSSQKWSAALQGKGPDGKIVGPMSQDAWTQKLMSDPQYGYDHTENARAAATNIVQQLGTAFGVIK